MTQPPPKFIANPTLTPLMSPEHREFLRKQFCPFGATDIEFEYFIGYCQKTGLDPMLKQVFFIERRSKNDAGAWVAKYEPMASESGMAARADAERDCRGISGGAVFETDVFSIDFATHEVIHKSQPLNRGKLIGAWAQAHREGHRQPPTWLRLEERQQTRYDKDTKSWQPTRFWQVMAPGMLLKCARAEQWRQAWPNIFGGVFIPEEMEEESDGPREAVRDVTPPDLTKAALPAQSPVVTLTAEQPPADGVPTAGPQPTPPAAAGLSSSLPRSSPPGPKFEQPEEAGIEAGLLSAAKRSDLSAVVKLINAVKSEERKAYWRGRYTARSAELPS